MEIDALIRQQVAAALAEDIGNGDISAELIDPDARLDTDLLVREDAVLCGTRWFEETFHQCDPAITIAWQSHDSDELAAGSVVCRVAGLARGLLTAERTALNFLQTLSGTATATRALTRRIAHTRCRILDTRKTIPLLRRAQKYAVACGGGVNHRLGLFDAFLIKENHLAASTGIAAAAARARALHPDRLLEIEVEDLAQLEQAIDVGVDRVLLDNFSLESLAQAVRLNRGRVELEASGNIDADNLVAIAETGIDFVSIGALTKHLHAVDFSLRYADRR